MLREIQSSSLKGTWCYAQRHEDVWEKTWFLTLELDVDESSDSRSGRINPEKEGIEVE